MRADVLDAEQIENSMAGSDGGDYVGQTSQANTKDDGQDINIRGSRSDATQYYVDGIKMIGGFRSPKAAIKEIKVISGGVPAMFGDATGGIVLITTKSYSDNSLLCEFLFYKDKFFFFTFRREPIDFFVL